MKHSDSHIKDRLSGEALFGEEAAQAAIWEGVAANLDAQKRKKGGFLWWMIPAVLLLGGAAWFGLSGDVVLADRVGEFRIQDSEFRIGVDGAEASEFGYPSTPSTGSGTLLSSEEGDLDLLSGDEEPGEGNRVETVEGNSEPRARLRAGAGDGDEAGPRAGLRAGAGLEDGELAGKQETGARLRAGAGLEDGGLAGKQEPRAGLRAGATGVEDDATDMTLAAETSGSAAKPPSASNISNSNRADGLEATSGRPLMAGDVALRSVSEIFFDNDMTSSPLLPLQMISFPARRAGFVSFGEINCAAVPAVGEGLGGELSVYGGINLSKLNYSDEPFGIDYQQPEWGSGFGAAYSLPLKNNFRLGIGLEHNTYWTRFEYSSSETRTEEWDNQLIEVVTNGITGDTVELVYGLGEVTIEENRRVIHHNRYRTLSIPVEWIYQKEGERFTYGLGTGLVLNFNLTSSGRGIDPEGSITTYENGLDPFPKVDVGVRLRPYLGYKLNNNWRLDVAPSILAQKQKVGEIGSVLLGVSGSIGLVQRF